MFDVRRRLALAVAAAACLTVSGEAAQRIGSNTVINTLPDIHHSRTASAADAAGNVCIAWQAIAGLSSSGWDVFGRCLDAAGTPLGDEFQVNTFTTGHQFAPAVAFDGGGNLVVVWWGPEVAFEAGGVFGRRFDLSGTPLGPEFMVNTTTTTRQSSPDIATDAAGNFIVVWTDYESEAIMGRRFDAGGMPLTGEIQMSDGTPFRFPRNPALAHTPTDEFLVVWDERPDVGDRDVVVRRFDADGTPSTAEFVVNTYTPGLQLLADVAVDGDGNALIVWVFDDPVAPTGLRARVLDPAGTPVGDEFRPTFFDASVDATGPHVSATTSGFALAWQAQSDDFEFAVKGRRLTGLGVFDGPEFQVSADGESHTYPSIAQQASGEFLVAWSRGVSSFPVLYDDVVVQRLGPRCGDALGEPPCTDQVVAGSTLVLKKTAKGVKLKLLSKDPLVPFPPLLGADDPSLNGATLTLVPIAEGPASVDIPGGTDAISLTKLSWRALESGQYGLRNKGVVGFPIRTVKLKDARLLKVAGVGLPLSMTAPLGAVSVRLRTGDVRACVRFDAGTVVRDEPGRFVAKGAAATLVDCSDASLGI